MHPESTSIVQILLHQRFVQGFVVFVRAVVENTDDFSRNLVLACVQASTLVELCYLPIVKPQSAELSCRKLDKLTSEKLSAFFKLVNVKASLLPLVIEIES